MSAFRLALVTALFTGVLFTPADLVRSVGAAEPAESIPPNTEPASSGKPMSPIEAARAIKLPDGFSATVFAAEPDVQNPIAMDFDLSGRLWVAENYTYSDRSEHFNLDLFDRVVVFDGTDNDAATSRRVFVDNVQMLTGIAVGGDGVYLMCPPRLLFVPDADRDAVPDGPPVTLLDGFEVAEANYHNFANGVRFGPDGWLYGRCGGSCPGRIGVPGTPDELRLALEGGMWRYHVPTKQVEVLTSGTTNPWGHAFDGDGNLFFINTVNGHFWHAIDGAHYTRPFTLDPNRRTYELIDFHADHWHFDTGGAWHESRDGAANDYGGGHAHCGLLIYDDDAWPDRYRGKAWTLNFHGRRINQESIEPHGTGFIARHNDDFALFGDPWFRGMELMTGPDGNVFVIDWSDAGECHEHDGVHRTSGRIYKIKHRDAPERSRIDMAALNDEALLAHAVGPSQWARSAALRELYGRQRAGRTSPINVAKSIASSADAQTPLTRILHAIEASKPGTPPDRGVDVDVSITSPIDSRSAPQRRFRYRQLTQHWPLDDAMSRPRMTPDRLAKVRGEWERHANELVDAAVHESDARNRLELASIISRMSVNDRPKMAAALAGHAEDAGDHNQSHIIWYGLIPVLDVDPPSLVDVVRSSRLPGLSRLITRGLAELIDDEPDSVNRVVHFAVDADPKLRNAVIQGLSDGLNGRRKVAMPDAWPQLIASNGGAESDPRLQKLSVLFGDGQAIDDLRRVIADENSDDAMRIAALESLIEARPDDLAKICAPLLDNPRLNVTAARGLIRVGDDPELGRLLASKYRRFRSPDRGTFIALMASRADTASAVLNAIGEGKIPRSALSAYDARQIRAIGDDQLNDRLTEVWGRITATDAAVAEKIDRYKILLTNDRLNMADLGNGRHLFNRQCAGCHKLYGQGENVGPNLTGAGRDNLDYLLSNIWSPSSVVDKDYRLSVVLTDDGRVISGLILDQSEHVTKVRTATETVTIAAEEIQQTRTTDLSPMPSGLMDALSDDEITDLIGYLKHPVQVPLPPAEVAGSP